MSIAGTAVAVLLSFPIAFLAARNTSPHPIVFRCARTLLNTLRSVPELIMGIIFVAAVGFGALSGVLALGLHSVGMVGKFFAEAIEHVDEAPVEAARAAGATPFQVLFTRSFHRYAAIRRHIDLSVGIQFPCLDRHGNGRRWRHRPRTDGSLRIMRYREVSAILFMILVMVTIVDWLERLPAPQNSSEEVAS